MSWDKVKPASEFDSATRIKLLAYGAPGSGKTTLASKFERPFVISTEKQGITTIHDVNPGALIFEVNSFDDLVEAMRMLQDPQLTERCDAVVIDSLTDAQRIMEDHFTAQSSVSADKVDWQTWGKLKNASIKMCRTLRDLPVHVVAIALLAEREQENGPTERRPDIKPKSLRNTVMQFFNLVGLTMVRKHGTTYRHELLFQGGDMYPTKGAPGLDPIEPPEPTYLAHKRWGTAITPDVAARVDEWKQKGAKK